MEVGEAKLGRLRVKSLMGRLYGGGLSYNSKIDRTERDDDSGAYGEGLINNVVVNRV